MKPLRLLARASLVMVCLSALTVAAQTSIAEQQDAQVIDNLRRHGADVTKPHDIDFYLVFNRESDAKATAEKLRSLGYGVAGVKLISSAKQWEVHANRKMVPELSAMQATTRALHALAQARGGYYDGWGTVGVK